jgi:hypothetical protein
MTKTRGRTDKNFEHLFFASTLKDHQLKWLRYAVHSPSLP